MSEVDPIIMQVGQSSERMALMTAPSWHMAVNNPVTSTIIVNGNTNHISITLQSHDFVHYFRITGTLENKNQVYYISWTVFEIEQRMNAIPKTKVVCYDVGVFSEYQGKFKTVSEDIQMVVGSEIPKIPITINPPPTDSVKLTVTTTTSGRGSVTSHPGNLLFTKEASSQTVQVSGTGLVSGDTITLTYALSGTDSASYDAPAA